MVDPVVKAKFFVFLRSTMVAVVSTVSASGQPMSATVYFVVDDDFNFYFMTKRSSRKAQNLGENEAVALVVGTENVPVTAQIQGKAEKIVSSNEYEMRKDQLIHAFSQNKFMAPLFQLPDDDILIFKITPAWIRWLDQRELEGEKGFVQIIP